MIRLRVEPRKVISWEELITKKDPYSVALDGYVYGATRFEPNGPYANFNHHEDVDRQSTRSTSAQVLLSIKVGLLKCFQLKRQLELNIFVNDCDQDTALAVWLLQNYKRIQGTKLSPAIHKLVFATDMLDATAGAYPFKATNDLLGYLAWIYRPYTAARFSGELSFMDAEEMEEIIEAVGLRIDQYSKGQGKKKELDTRYEKIYQGEGWALVREIGTEARTQLFHDGVHAFVSIREGVQGEFVCSICKLSAFVDYPLELFYKKLNEREGIADYDLDRWGGSNTTGGSPRKRGCRLSISELVETMEETYKEYQLRRSIC